MVAAGGVVVAVLVVALALGGQASDGSPADGDETSVSPVLMVKPERWRTAGVAASSQPAAAQALDALVARAERWTRTDPQPVAQIVYQGRLAGDPQRVRTVAALGDMRRLRDLAYAFAVTGKAAYADAAGRYLGAWVRTCAVTADPINMNKLAMIPVSYDLVRDRLGAADRQQVEAWIKALAERQAAGQGTSHANWESKRLKLLAFCGVAVGDEARVRQAVEGLQAWVGRDLRPDGRSLDLEERDALTYHVNGLVSALEVAVAVQNRGPELYAYEAPSGASLRKSVAFVVPYAHGEKTYPQWTRSKVHLDKARFESGDERYRPGTPWDRSGGLALFELASLVDPALQPVAADLRALDAGPATWVQVLSTGR